MNRTFEERKSTKVYAKSEENKAIIKALNMYGRVPEQWELLKEIEKLQQENKQLKEKIDILLEDNNQLEEIRIKATKYIKEKQWFSYTKGHNIIDEVGIEDLLQILGENENE